MQPTAWQGIYPATVLPYEDDLSIDSPGLRRLGEWLLGVEGVSGLLCNGHAGEVSTLTRSERALVVGTLAAVGSPLGKAIISGISTESTSEAVEHAEDAKQAGATALLVMPVNSWLRFGRSSETALEYFKAINAVGLPLIIHQYPAWTKVTYTIDELLAITESCDVAAVKMGERNIALLEHHVRTLRTKRPELSLLSCHDEYLLSSFVFGLDGALVGFGSIVPELISDLFMAVIAGDLRSAQELNNRLYPLKKAIYGEGEPSGEAHARAKEMLRQIGRIERANVRPPVLPLTATEIAEVGRALAQAGIENKTEVSV